MVGNQGFVFNVCSNLYWNCLYIIIVHLQRVPWHDRVRLKVEFMGSLVYLSVQCRNCFGHEGEVDN